MGQMANQVNKAIFWDCDGTLVHDNESFKCSLLRALQEFGYCVSEEAVKGFLKGACSWNKPEEDHSDANGEEWWERLLVGMRGFCEEQGVTPIDAVSVCNAFRKNVISYEYEAYPEAKKEEPVSAEDLGETEEDPDEIDEEFDDEDEEDD